ncbi:hypothetical protein Hte_011919 [Hypoxylon texense]
MDAQGPPQSPGQTGTAAYSEGVDGAGRTLNFFKDFDSFLGNPFSSFVASKAIRRRFQLELGEWHGFLYDRERGIYLTPVLTAAGFSGYLDSCKGAFRPRGRCRATAAWAQFLYGLGITPETGVVSRKFVRLREGDSIALEVDGEAVCHAVNLLDPGNMCYRVGDLSLVAKSYGSHSTSIGNITWGIDLETKNLSLSYVPCSEDQLRRHHKFFPSWPQKDPVDLMARYSLSLELGTSHTELVWPPPSTPLRDRIEFQYNKLLGEIPAKNRPVFLTGRWVEGGERIYRRAFGGEQVDEVFANVCAKLDPDSSWFDVAVEMLRKGLKSPPPHVLYYREKGIGGDPSSPWGDPTRSASGDVRSALANTLRAYGDEPEGSWKHALYLCRDRIPHMLWQERSYIVDDEEAIIVPLDSTAALWHGKSLQLR